LFGYTFVQMMYHWQKRPKTGKNCQKAALLMCHKGSIDRFCM